MVGVLLSLMVILFIRESCPGPDLVPLISDIYDLNENKKRTDTKDSGSHKHKKSNDHKKKLVSIHTLFELFPYFEGCRGVVSGGSGSGPGSVSKGRAVGDGGLPSSAASGNISKIFDPISEFLKFGGNNGSGADWSSKGDDVSNTAPVLMDSNSHTHDNGNMTIDLRNTNLTVSLISSMRVDKKILEIVSIFNENRRNLDIGKGSWEGTGGFTLADMMRPRGLGAAVRMRYECLDSSYPPLKDEEIVVRGKLLEVINSDS